MLLKNIEIYNFGENLKENFDNLKRVKMPAKVGFYFRQNAKLLFDKAKEIEIYRCELIKQYGIYEENEDKYTFTEENLNKLNEEIKNLMQLEQEISIKTISLSLIENVDLTLSQLEALEFMISEEE